MATEWALVNSGASDVDNDETDDNRVTGSISCGERMVFEQEIHKSLMMMMLFIVDAAEWKV